MTKSESLSKKLIHDYKDLQNMIFSMELDALTGNKYEKVFKNKDEVNGYLNVVQYIRNHMEEKMHKWKFDREEY